MRWNKSNNSNETGLNILIVLLFLACPFISFLISLRNPQRRFNQFIIILYFGLLGLVRKLYFAGDAATWTQQIHIYSQYGTKEVIERIMGYSGHNAAYQWFLFILSKIHYTSIIWCILFMMTVAIYIYVYNLQFVDSKRLTRNLSFHNILLFVFFIGCIPFTSWGVKFWMALDVFLIGYYLCINRERKVGVLFILMSVLFHYSFLFLAFVYIIYYIINKNNFTVQIVLCCILSIFIYFSYNTIVNGFVESKFVFYSENSFIGQHNIFVQLNRVIMALFSVTGCLYLYYKGKKNDNKLEKQTLKFLLLFALGLILLIPTADGLDRFSRVFSFMFLISLIRLSFYQVRNAKNVLLISYPIFGLNFLINLFLNRGELDLHIFYENVFYFFSGNMMTQIIH